jgi:hypothetical protein
VVVVVVVVDGLVLVVEAAGLVLVDILFVFERICIYIYIDGFRFFYCCLLFVLK